MQNNANEMLQHWVPGNIDSHANCDSAQLRAVTEMKRERTHLPQGTMSSSAPQLAHTHTDRREGPLPLGAPKYTQSPPTLHSEPIEAIVSRRQTFFTALSNECQ